MDKSAVRVSCSSTSSHITLNFTSSSESQFLQRGFLKSNGSTLQSLQRIWKRLRSEKCCSVGNVIIALTAKAAPFVWQASTFLSVGRI